MDSTVSGLKISAIYFLNSELLFFSVYVDASEDCNVMYFSLMKDQQINRAWNIRVTQYDCDHVLRAPPGCLQYFYDQDNEGVMETFNFANRVHLANQYQTMCIRREFANCRICYYHAPDDFAVSAPSIAGSGYIGKRSECCNVGTSGADQSNYDCVIIPNPTGKENSRNVGGNGHFCGGKLVTSTATNADTICSKKSQFV